MQIHSVWPTLVPKICVNTKMYLCIYVLMHMHIETVHVSICMFT